MRPGAVRRSLCRVLGAAVSIVAALSFAYIAGSLAAEIAEWLNFSFRGR